MAFLNSDEDKIWLWLDLLCGRKDDWIQDNRIGTSPARMHLEPLTINKVPYCRIFPFKEENINGICGKLNGWNPVLISENNNSHWMFQETLSSGTKMVSSAKEYWDLITVIKAFSGFHQASKRNKWLIIGRRNKAYFLFWLETHMSLKGHLYNHL